MSSKFTYLKGNCPICAGSSKQCRQSKLSNWIHCRGEVGIVPSGWESKGFDSWGFAMFGESSSNQEDAAERLQRQQAYAQKRQREKEELAKGALAPADRNQAIWRIRGEFGLTYKHHQNLFDRGLTQKHIDRLPYFSFIDNQEVPRFTPANLPGVRNGKLAVKGTGFACPIPDIDGLIIGWQYRFDDVAEGKYRWPRGEKSIHLANGELPIGVYRPNKGITPQKVIGHAEGFLKSDIIAQKWNLPVLGAASANFAASPEQWQLSLERLSEEFQTKDVLWFADAGSVTNHHVIAQYQKAWEKLIEWDYSVLIVWYGQIEKSVGDADEISEEIRKSAQLLTIADYLSIANQNGSNIEQKQVITTETDSRYSIEPNSIEYEAYTQWETEQELIDEAEKKYRVEQREEQHDEKQKQNICNWIKTKIRGIKRLTKWKNTVTKLGRELPKIPEVKNVLYYRSGMELPKPEDFAIIRGIIDDDEIKPPKIIYKKGQRIEVWMKLKQAGWQFIFDKSFMGQGKSYDAGSINPDPNDATNVDKDGLPNNKVFYFDLNHNNPSTDTVETMTNLQARHDGMVAIENKFTPSGAPHLRRAKDNEVERTPSNCMNANLFVALQQKGYDINAYKEEVQDDKGKTVQRNKICKNCPWVGKCHNEIGDGYGYYAQRKRAFAAQRIRASIDSMPDHYDMDYSGSVAYVEEAASYLKGTNSVTATEQEVNQVFSRIERQDFELFMQLQSFRFALQNGFNGEFSEVIKGRNRGANHYKLMENLPSPLSVLKISAEEEAKLQKQGCSVRVDLLDRILATIPKANEIIEEADSVKDLGGKWKDAGALARRMFKAEAQKKTLENIENLPTNILGDLFAVWLGLKPGTLRVTGKKLTVTTKAKRQVNILTAMKCVVLLDATGDKKHLAKVLDVDRNEIIEIAEETPNLSNLEIINVDMPGMGSRDVSAECQQRQLTFINWVKERYWDTDVKTLGYKSDDHLPLDGYWFRDNRGTNAFKNSEVIVSFNTPRINVGVAQDDYLTLYGSLEGFEKYYDHLIKNEQIQWTGRSRAHLTPNCRFLLYIVGTNQDLDYLTEEFGIKVTNKSIVELCPDAAKAGDRTLKMICDVCWEVLKETGSLVQVTTEKVGDAIGKARQTVSKTIKRVFGSWENFKRCLLSLLDIYRKGGQASDLENLDDISDSVFEQLEWLAHTYLPAAVKDEPPDDLLIQVGLLWSYGEFAYIKLVSLLSSDLRQKLAKTMLFALGAEFSTEILRELGEGIP